MLGLLQVLSRKFDRIVSSFSELLCFFPSELFSRGGRLCYTALPIEVQIGLVAELKLIRGEARGFVWQNSLGEVYCGQKVRPIVLEVIDEGTEALIDVLVENLRIPVGLRVVGR